MRKKHLTYRQTGGILLGYEEEVSASHLDCNHAVGLIIDKYALTVCLLKRITYYPLFLFMEVRDN